MEYQISTIHVKLDVKRLEICFYATYKEQVANIFERVVFILAHTSFQYLFVLWSDDMTNPIQTFGSENFYYL